MNKNHFFSKGSLCLLIFLALGVAFIACKKDVKPEISTLSDDAGDLPDESSASRTSSQIIIDNNFYANTLRKGFGGPNNVVSSFNLDWEYNWTRERKNLKDSKFYPMIFGKYDTSRAALHLLKKDIMLDSVGRIILLYNEPNGADQANMSAKRGIQLFQTIWDTLSSLPSSKSVTFVSPVPTQMGSLTSTATLNPSRPTQWLDSFMNGDVKVNGSNVKIKTKMNWVGVHWYDWGKNPGEGVENYSNYSVNKRKDTASAAAHRLLSYLKDVITRYDKNIFLLEYNANKWRADVNLQKYFMYYSTKRMDSLNNLTSTTKKIARYAFFFAPTYPGWDANGNLTSLGNEWKFR